MTHIRISAWGDTGRHGADIFAYGKLVGSIVADEINGGYEVAWLSDLRDDTHHPSYKAASAAARKALNS